MSTPEDGLVKAMIDALETIYKELQEQRRILTALCKVTAALKETKNG